MINIELLNNIIESLSNMINYVEDELLERYDNNSEICKDTKKANKLLDTLYEIKILNKEKESE